MPDENTAGRVWNRLSQNEILRNDISSRDILQAHREKQAVDALLGREISEGVARNPVYAPNDPKPADTVTEVGGATGVKNDDGKPRMDLLDPLALEGLAQVLTFGANKYAAHNWRGGIAYSRLIAAAFRHLFAFLRGEDKDPESGLPHVDHAACCLMFLANMHRTRKDLDDRYVK